ncbi:MAG: hypothetical protein ACUVRO_02475 [Armatimonadota bacterium]
MPVKSEVRPYGNGCRFLAARHKMLFTGNRSAPTKDEITQLICGQGRRITWDDEEKCLASVSVCWKLAEQERPAEGPSTADETAKEMSE